MNGKRETPPDVLAPIAYALTSEFGGMCDCIGQDDGGISLYYRPSSGHALLVLDFSRDESGKAKDLLRVRGGMPFWGLIAGHFPDFKEVNNEIRHQSSDVLIEAAQELERLGNHQLAQKLRRI